jgi:chemotaxis protein MotA
MTTTIIGILVGISVMVIAIIEVTTQGTAKVMGVSDMYLSIPAFLIVMGGTIAATLVAHPFSHLVRGFYAFFVVFIRKEFDFVDTIEEICDASAKYTKDGLKGLEEKLKTYKADDLLKDGLTMLVNGYKTEEVYEYLETNIQRKYDREMVDFYVFRTMGKTAPAFGMVGTLVGLIFMMRVLSESPEKMGAFLSVALVATFYGVIFANLFFNPMSNKLLVHAEQNFRIGRMQIEGIMYILKKQHPIYIKDKLSVYMPPRQRKQLFKNQDKK